MGPTTRLGYHFETTRDDRSTSPQHATYGKKASALNPHDASPRLKSKAACCRQTGRRQPRLGVRVIHDAPGRRPRSIR